MAAGMAGAHHWYGQMQSLFGMMMGGRAGAPGGLGFPMGQAAMQQAAAQDSGKKDTVTVTAE